jgi:hypothetical protein
VRPLEKPGVHLKVGIKKISALSRLWKRQTEKALPSGGCLNALGNKKKITLPEK